MWPWLLGSAGLGAALGGIGEYQRSGGDLGATLRGATAGGATGLLTGGLGQAAGGFAASRMAGALPLKMLAQKAVSTGGLTGIEKALLSAPGAVGGLTALGTQAVTAPLISGLAGGATNLAGQAFGGLGRAATAAGGGAIGTGAALGVGRPKPTGELVSQGGAVPAGLEDLTGLPTTMRVIDPRKEYAAALLMEKLEQDTALEGMKKIAPYMYQVSEASKKSEMERQMAAAQIRQNIATAANLVQQSQQSAQQMGRTAAQQMGSAITSQYQYS